MNQNLLFQRWRRLLLPVLLLCICILQSHSTRANHLYGGEMYYKVHNDSLTIYVAWYADCNGIAGLNPNVSVTSSCMNTSFTLKSNEKGLDVTPVAPGHCSRCSSSSCTFGFGIQKEVYYGTIALDTTCCEYTLSCSWSNRASGITTGAAGEEFYLEAIAKTCMGDYSSPIFFSPPPLLVHKNICNTISQSAYSSDGLDSLVYALTPPMQSASMAASYKSGYSYNAPFQVSSSGLCKGFNYNSRSGSLKFMATKEDLTVMAFSVLQYRKDKNGKYQYFGKIGRDIMSVAADWGNNANNPSLLSAKDTFYTCANTKLTAKFLSNDLDGDSIFISMSKLSTFGGSYSITSGTYSTLTFEWTPQASDIRSEPYYLLITAKDNKSPSGITQKSFPIYVIDTFPTYKVSQADSGCGKYSFNVKVDSSLIQSYSWQVGTEEKSKQSSFVFEAPANGGYDINLILTGKNGCTNKYTQHIDLKILPAISLGPVHTVCEGDSIQLSAKGGDKYTWRAADGTLYNGSATFVKPAHSMMYYLTAWNSNGCKASDSIWVEVDTMKLHISNDTLICAGKGASLQATFLPDYTYKWEPAEGLTAVIGNKVTARPTKTTTYTVTATSTHGCVKKASVTVNIYKPHVSAGPDVQLCKGDSVQLHASGGIIYTWRFAPGIHNINVPNPYVHPVSDQKYIVGIRDSMDCSTILDTVFVKVNELKTTISGDGSICKGDTGTLSVSGGHTQLWSPAKWLSSTTAATPKAFPTANTWFYVTSSDTITGCSIKDSIYIKIVNDCVWPGDANYDGTANYLDLLTLGLGYSKSGSVRNNASSNWKPQQAIDWALSTPQGINYKHADANGDGIITATDTSILVTNYGRTHTGGINITEPSGNTPLYFALEKDTFYAGDTVHAYLSIGDMISLVNDFYGIGFQHNYTTPFIVNGSYKLDLDSRFLGSSTSLLTYKNASDASMVRTDQMGVSGYGKVAGVSFVLKDSTYPYSTSGDWIHLHLKSARAIDNTGKLIPLKLQDDSAIVFRKRTSGIARKSYDAGFRLYPNPASQRLIIEGPQTANKILIIDMLGKEVLNVIKPNHSQLSLDVSMLTPGIYTVLIETQEGTAWYKVSIDR